jgi:hypothetical protein
MLLKEMKNQENCNHKKIAIEKIKIIESPKPFYLLDTEEIKNIEGKNHKVILCLECGKELKRS